MEFLSANIANTTTLFTTTAGGTGTLANLVDRNVRLEWGSVGNTTDTSSLISIQFGTNTVISNLFLQNHNLRQYRIFFNSVTANTFTPDINISGASVTSTYFLVTSVTVQSIQIQIDRSITDDTERSIGEWFAGFRQLQFTVNPSIEQFNPVTSRTQVLHKMPDGGMISYFVRDKFKADLEFSFITDAFRNNLFNAFNNAQPLYFLEFPTTTAWDGAAREIIITSDFDFKYGTNQRAQGWNGAMRIEETPGV